MSRIAFRLNVASSRSPLTSCRKSAWSDPEAETRQTERATKVQELLGIDQKLIDALETEDKEAQAADVPQRRRQSGWDSRTSGASGIPSQAAVSIVRRMYPQAAEGQRDFPCGRFGICRVQRGKSWELGALAISRWISYFRAPEFDELPASVVARLRREDDAEHRANLTGVVDTAGALTYMDRLFSASDGAYLGAIFPAVGPGRHTYPIVTGSTVAATVARGTAQAAAGGLATVDADPERIQMSYEIGAVDELRMPGIGGYLATDLRNALMAGLDNKVIDDLVTALTEVNDNTVVTLDEVLGSASVRGGG